jgi:hypothetical protein
VARRSKEELIAEFHRLYDLFETLTACQEPLFDPDDFKWFNEHVPTREHMLECLADGKVTASELVQGTQQGVNDYLSDIEGALEDEPEKAKLVLVAYKERTGRNLFDDVGNPKKTAKLIFKRGKIENDTEFYLLKEVMSNVDQTVFKELQATKAYAMLDEYDRRNP